MLEKIPLVLLHGWGLDSCVWDSVIPELEKTFVVIAIDLPCFGNNPLCSADINEVAENVVAQLPPKSILVGWSLGGLIATYIAIHHSERVAALVTVGSNLKWLADADTQWPGASADNFAAFFENLAQNSEVTHQHFCGVIARGDSQEKFLAKKLRQHISNTAQENFLTGLRLLNNIDNRKNFATLSAPGLHIFGGKDVMVPLAVEQALRALNKKHRTYIMAGAAHAPFLSEPVLFAELIRNFVQSLSSQLEKKYVAESFSKAATTYDSAAQLQRDISDRLWALLPAVQAQRVLDLGCGTGTGTVRLQQYFPQAQVLSLDIAPGMLQQVRKKHPGAVGVCADAEALPFKNDSLDIIFSSLAIQWCQAYPQLFAELYRVLAPGGSCVISTFRSGTLQELKTAWQAADAHVHVNAFADSAELREAAQQAGFCSIDMHEQTLVQYYATVKELTAELKAIGAHNINSGRPDGLTGKQKLKKMLDAYEQFRCDGLLPASYEIVFLILKKE